MTEIEKASTHLDWTKAEERKAFIHETESGIYGSTDNDGVNTTVMLTKGKGMEIWKTTNNGLTEVISYNHDGYQQSISHVKI